MRRIACLLLVALVSAACSGPTATTATDPAVTTATVTGGAVTPSDRGPDAASYQLLVADVVGFVAQASEAEARHPDASPETPEEVLALTGYRLADGVELVAYSDRDAQICFTGPTGTYLTFTEPDSGDDLLLALGRGPCSYGEGDVVVALFVPEGSTTYALESRVVTGDAIAADVPALDDFVDLLNVNTTVTTEVPEG